MPPVAINRLWPVTPRIERKRFIQWIIENEGMTIGLPNWVMPAFSGSATAVTPVTFTGALGYNQAPGVSGDPTNGFPVVWSDWNENILNLANVALAIRSEERR